MNERSMRFGLGLFVAVSLLLLGTLIVLFRSIPRMFRGATPYTVVFSEAPGVETGTPVRRSGVRIGEVTSVNLDDERGGVIVGLAIDRSYKVRENEQPVLVTSLLGGDATVDFVPKPVVAGEEPDRSQIPPGSEITGGRQVTVSSLLNRASELAPATQETMNDIRKSLQRLEKMSPLIEESVREYRDLARDARAAVPDMRKTIDEVRDLTHSVREAVPDVRRGIDDVAATARTYTKLGERIDVLVEANQDRVEKTIELVNQTLARIEALFSEENQRNLNAILNNVRAASDKFDEIARSTADITKEGRVTVRRLNDSLVKMDEVLTTVQKTMKPVAERSESVVRNFEEILVRLNRTLTDVNTVLRNVGQSDGTLNRLLTDPSLFNNINCTVLALQRMLPRVDRVLENIETFADKLARHPELLGVRGAIHPDPGLK